MLPPQTSAYFAYGSNLCFPQLRERAPSAKPLGPAELHGYRLAFTRKSIRWNGLAADVVPDPGDSVWGALYSLDVDDYQKLDRSEFLGTGYRRISVDPVLQSRAIPVAAFTYEVIDRQPEGRPPPEYLARMIAGARATGLPETWIDKLVEL